MSEVTLTIEKFSVKAEGDNAAELLDELLGRFCGALMMTSRRMPELARALDDAAPDPDASPGLAPRTDRPLKSEISDAPPRRRARPACDAMVERLLARLPNPGDWLVMLEHFESPNDKKLAKLVAETDARLRFVSFGRGIPARIERVAAECRMPNPQCQESSR